ncbi:MAG: DUF4838 domain-containing protein [Victivallales bacterium]|nr:DUF4838 domain-containing protein [Victivallales bacterium]
MIPRKSELIAFKLSRTRFFCCLLLLFCSFVMHGAEYFFAENGKAQCLIALPAKPMGFEQDAADDLRTYLGKMTGAEFTVLSEEEVPAGKSAIYVGQTDYARKQNVRFDQLSAEEWVIRTAENNLILSGGKPIGSFYAVWNLLNQFGCYCLTWDQEAIPNCRTLKREIQPQQSKPVFSGRFIYNRYPPILNHTKATDQIKQMFAKWKLRNGQNGRHNPVDNQWTYSAHYITHYPNFHSLSLYVDPKLFKEHPEYFSMNEAGKRFAPRSFQYGGSVCMSNPKVAKVTLDSLRKMIQEDREKLPREKWPTVYDISELDGTGYICKCPECMAILKEEGSQSGLLLRYINAVAREIGKEYPDVLIRTACYGFSTGTPPKKVRPESNVLVQLCDKWSISDPFHPLSHPINADRIPYFEEWRKISRRIQVWDYWNLSKEPHPDTVFDAMVSDLRYFRSLNVTDLFLEAERNPHTPQSFIDLCYFVASQLMLNPEKDAEKLVDIYFQHYFGPAAVPMRNLFEDIRNGMKQQKIRQTSRTTTHWSYLTPDFMSSRYVELKKLSESLPEGDIYRKRVNAERLPFIWYVLIRRESYRKAFKEHGVNVDDLVQEWRTLVDEYVRRYPCEKPYEESKFEKALSQIGTNIPRPEKFKSVPTEDFRLVAWPYFRGHPTYCSSVVDDADSIAGKALKSANPDADFHGVDKRLPGRNGKVTQFNWRNLKLQGGVRLLIKEVPQDEKYHWYRFPGKLELKDNPSLFYGHGEAINADTGHLFDFLGDAQANTWDAWFSAKFTGPAYVKGSTKENAIFIDMLVLTRGDVK